MDRFSCSYCLNKLDHIPRCVIWYFRNFRSSEERSRISMVLGLAVFAATGLCLLSECGFLPGGSVGRRYRDLPLLGRARTSAKVKRQIDENIYTEWCVWDLLRPKLLWVIFPFSKWPEGRMISIGAAGPITACSYRNRSTECWNWSDPVESLSQTLTRFPDRKLVSIIKPFFVCGCC